ncbi:uncharacterized protein MCAP_0864-like [Macrobrachium rosenbergii]|uniref:uncharacterized protein MCAP_0864-like n=1 Tax=Macrobrachium rosenbergii TaxID=79674 RepID=UPI0034D61474
MTAEMDAVDRIMEELEGKIKILEESQSKEITLVEVVNSGCLVYPRLQILKLKSGTFLLSKGKGTVESGRILEELKSSLEKEKAEVSSTKIVIEDMRKQLIRTRTEKEGLVNNIKKFCEIRGREEEFILAMSQYTKNILCPPLEIHHKTAAELEEELEGFQTKAEEVKDSYHEVVRSHQQVQCLKKEVEQEQENLNMLQSRRSTMEMKIKATTTKLVENKEQLQKQYQLLLESLSEDGKFISCIEKALEMHLHMFKEMEPVICSLSESNEVTPTKYSEAVPGPNEVNSLICNTSEDHVTSCKSVLEVDCTQSDNAFMVEPVDNEISRLGAEVEIGQSPANEFFSSELYDMELFFDIV